VSTEGEGDDKKFTAGDESTRKEVKGKETVGYVAASSVEVDKPAVVPVRAPAEPEAEDAQDV
jgi:hypothetical protein